MQIFLPATGSLYFSLSSIWGLPFGEQVVGSIMALVLFLGMLLQVSSAQYKNSNERFSGEIEIDDEKETSVLKMDSSALLDKEEVTLKVNKINQPKKPRKRK